MKPSAEQDEIGYDRIRIPLQEGGHREITKQQFDALPLAERVGMLVTGRLQFFRGGRLIPPHRAMRSR